MAYSTIIKPNTYFNTITWTADGTSPRSFTGVGFQPDLVWGKRRSVAADHNLFDVVRGAGSDKALMSNSTDAEGSASPSFGYLSSLDSDGFTTTTGSTNNNYWNNGTDTYVGWNWKAGGTTSSNTDGTITSSVSASTTAGFSIVSWTGTGATATVGHGLGTTPKLFIVKERSEARNWPIITTAIDGSWDALYLNNTDVIGNSPQSANSSVFNFTSSNEFNASGQTYIAYAFADVKGFSKIGSYVGNGSADGTFVYTGFKPAFVLMKNTADAGGSWQMFDNKRDVDNVANHRLFPNASSAESTVADNNIDIISNGFKMRTSNGDTNSNGVTFIYMAFAENPLVSNTSGGIPTTAR